MKPRSQALAVLLLAPLVAVADSPPPVVEEEPLTELARAVLKRKMGRHGADYAQLSIAAVLLEYEAVAGAAARIASEPRLLRPVVGGEDDLNASIPERFFVLQDVVREKAQRLAAAARLRNLEQTQANFAQLSAACAGCHASYRGEEAR